MGVSVALGGQLITAGAGMLCFGAPLLAGWVAGFDLFYSLLDLEIDRVQGLHSIAVRFGVNGVFRGARLLHLITAAALAYAGYAGRAGIFWAGGVAAVVALLTYEHLIVSPRSLRHLNAAFFTVNGVIAVVFLSFVLVDALV